MEIKKYTHYYKNPLKDPCSVTLYSHLHHQEPTLWESFKIIFFAEHYLVRDFIEREWFEIVWDEKRHTLYILNSTTDEEVQRASRR